MVCNNILHILLYFFFDIIVGYLFDILIKWGRFEFLKFSQNRGGGGSDFSHKKGGVGKIGGGGVAFKKGRCHLFSY